MLCRVLTILHDSLTARLLELAFARHGAPPVDYAWLVFGSAARNELTLASDQDNGLAYADTDDPAVDEYFRRVAEDVNGGLTRCGIEPDSHSVLASIAYWRKTLTGWKDVFSECLDGKDLKRVVRASVCFDYRQAAGGLYVTQALTDIMREAPKHPRFLQWLARLGSDTPPSIGGFRQKLDAVVDIKDGGLLPIQNMARYHALARGITIQATLERLAAVCDLDAEGAECDRTLRESYLTMNSCSCSTTPRPCARGASPTTPSTRAPCGPSPARTSRRRSAQSRRRRLAFPGSPPACAAEPTLRQTGAGWLQRPPRLPSPQPPTAFRGVAWGGQYTRSQRSYAPRKDWCRRWDLNPHSYFQEPDHRA